MEFNEIRKRLPSKHAIRTFSCIPFTFRPSGHGKEYCRSGHEINLKFLVNKSKIAFAPLTFPNTFIEDMPEVKTFKVHTYPPPITPYVGFNAKVDGEKLRAALEGAGTNEQCIIGILTTRSNAQRQEIAAWYKNSFDRDLIDDFKTKLSGKFGDVIVGLMTTPEVYLCNQLHKALTGLSTNEDALVEILCTKTNKEMAQLIETYEDLYDRPLVEHLCSATGGHFRRLLTRIVTGNRDESDVVDPVLATMQAVALHESSKAELTDEELFNRILTHDNFALLREVFLEYKIVSGRTIEEAIFNEISGDLKEALLTIIECVHSAPDYFAKRLFNATNGILTSDATIIRIIVSRSEIDLGIIKTEFERLYHQTLLSVLKNKTSGDYKHVLCRIIG